MRIWSIFIWSLKSQIPRFSYKIKFNCSIDSNETKLKLNQMKLNFTLEVNTFENLCMNLKYFFGYKSYAKSQCFKTFSLNDGWKAFENLN